MKKDLLFHPAGESARPVPFVLTIHMTVGEVLEAIRGTHLKEMNVMYFYVVDDMSRLLGVVKTRDLLSKGLSEPISSVLQTRLHVVQSFQTLYDALMLMQKYHLLAIPVLEKGKLIGALDVTTYFEEAVQLDSAKKRQDIFQTLGIIVDETESHSLWYKYRMRMPWLFCNIIGGLLCALISQFYKVLLIKIIVLAMFIPLVLSLAESLSMQAMSHSFFQLARSARSSRSILAYLFVELKLFVLISITSAFAVGLVSLLWAAGPMASLVIGTSIFITIIIAALMGSSIPIFLHKFNLDPKIASGPIVLMLADIVTTLIYLTLGAWALL
ncbi:MAG: hypothetical protein A3F09_00625 [Chlamydiae bacterium RIFCSPHIGHO2_12_FULL_49_11]|nr:MAG: hypothetical protein A3F09_00625 [Chlamydiae bacterium RIFCSPHIGHO2_12_FULL_49_11]